MFKSKFLSYFFHLQFVIVHLLVNFKFIAYINISAICLPCCLFVQRFVRITKLLITTSAATARQFFIFIIFYVPEQSLANYIILICFIYRQKRTRVCHETNRGRLAKKNAILSLVEQSTSSSSFESTPKRSAVALLSIYLCIFFKFLNFQILLHHVYYCITCRFTMLSFFLMQRFVRLYKYCAP